MPRNGDASVVLMCWVTAVLPRLCLPRAVGAALDRTDVPEPAAPSVPAREGAAPLNLVGDEALATGPEPIEPPARAAVVGRTAAVGVIFIGEFGSVRTLRVSPLRVCDLVAVPKVV